MDQFAVPAVGPADPAASIPGLLAARVAVSADKPFIEH